MKFRPNENVLRVTLIVFCVIFAVLSVSLIALGIIYIDDLWWPRKYVGLDFLALPTLVIILGTLSFIMSIIGCLCAKSYNKKLFSFFLVSLVVILILELTVAVISFDSMSQSKHQKLRETMEDYLNTKDLAEMERHFGCCGVSGSEFYCPNYNSTTTEYTLNGCYDITVEIVDTVGTRIGYYSTSLACSQILEMIVTMGLYLKIQ